MKKLLTLFIFILLFVRPSLALPASANIISSPICGDGQCDTGEICTADNSGCSSGYACTNGCITIVEKETTGGSSVGSGGSFNSGTTNKTTQTNLTDQALVKCQENWQCMNWSTCINDTQTRTCIDLNKCNTSENKSIESQTCTMITKPEEKITENISVPTGLFLGLSTGYWIIAIAALAITIVIIFGILMKRKVNY